MFLFVMKKKPIAIIFTRSELRSSTCSLVDPGPSVDFLPDNL